MSLRSDDARVLFDRYTKSFPKEFPLANYKNVYKFPEYVKNNGDMAEWIPTKEIPNYRLTAGEIQSDGTISLVLEEYYKEPILSEFQGHPLRDTMIHKDKTHTYRYSTIQAAQFPSCCGVVRVNHFSYAQKGSEDMHSLLVTLFQHWIWQCGYTYALGILALQPEWEKVFKGSKKSIQCIGSDKSRRTGSQLDLYKIYAVQPNY